VKKKFAPNAWADRMSVPRFMRFERPSAPTAKYPRIFRSVVLALPPLTGKLPHNEPQAYPECL
jgi:hypothetical protein